MATIIGEDPEHYHTAPCKNCGGIVQYVEEELEERTWYDYGGFKNGETYLECPRCKNEILIRSY